MEPRPFIYYLPIATTILTIVFAQAIYRHYVQRGRTGNHLLWWTIGVITYGMGTFAEGYSTLFGLNPGMLKFWYVVGALMGGAPLATGTVWLLLKPNAARYLTGAFLGVLIVSSFYVVLSPVDMSLIDSHLPSGQAFGWRWVRWFSPFINTYAVIFLIGGAIISAWRYYWVARAGAGEAAKLGQDRFIGNTFIAIGAILPAIGGASSRAGHTEILYILELIGIILIWLGYRFNIRRQPLDEPLPARS